MITMKFVELHSPLFLAGTNLGQKLDVAHKPVRLLYDRVEKELFVIKSNQIAIIPASNVVSMTPLNPKDAGIDEKELQTEAKLNMHASIGPAQASSPLDHVFAGPGAGKVKQ